MTQVIDNKGFWWAVQGSNLWPLPCQKWGLAVCKAFWRTTGDFGPLWFTIRYYTPWATVGQISNPVAKASKVETGMAEGIKPLVRRNNRQTGLRVGGMARTMQGESHLLSGLTGRRDAHTLPVCKGFSSISDAFDRLWFTIGCYSTLGHLGRISP